MWISKRLSLIAVTSSDISDEKRSSSFNARASALINRFNKPLPPILGGSCYKKETFVFVVSGGPDIGKSTFIRFGLQNLIAKHDSNRPDLQCHQTKLAWCSVEYPIDVIEINANNLLEASKGDCVDLLLPSTAIHSGLVCYDITNRDSIDIIPDLLDFYLSRNIPTFLVGLKGDQASACKVNPELIQKIVDLFSLKHFIVDAFSETGVQRMKDIYYELLLDHHCPDSYTTTTTDTTNSTSVNNNNSSIIVDANESSIYSEIKPRSTMDYDSLGPAPQDFLVKGPSQAGNENYFFQNVDADNNDECYHNNENHGTPNYQKRITSTIFYCVNNNNGPSSRRGSKDSSVSSVNYLTSEDIVDRLLSTKDNEKKDKNIIPIFLMFFRRFMRPYELVRILVERFENDGLSSDALPTDLQKRIHEIFFFWLSHYWNDFCASYAREHLILFLDRISKYETLTPICDSLAPLVVREPSTYDPDKFWGLVDIEHKEEEQSLPPTPSSFKTVERNERKDSAYSSGTFSIKEAALPTKPEHLDSTTAYQHYHADNNTNLTAVSLPPTPTSPGLFPPTFNRILPNGGAVNKLNKLRLELQPSLHHSSNFSPLHYAKKSPLVNRMTMKYSINKAIELPNQSEFAGGLINIDNVTNNKNSGHLQSPAFDHSIEAAQSIWKSTLGSRTFTSSFLSISAFKQNREEKDQSNNSYKFFKKRTDTAIAEQLTWIEAELFSKIEPRAFIRKLWSLQQDPSNKNINSTVTTPSSSTAITTESRPASDLPLIASVQDHNAVLASIAHFNFISAWVVTMIVTQSNLNRRIELLKRFMSIAVELRNQNNYSTLIAILAGISNAAVSRLKRTKQKVTTESVYKRFQSLEVLASPVGSYSRYRMAFQASKGYKGAEGDGGIIPHLGIHFQDLLSNQEANKDSRNDGAIHWEKFRLMGETIMEIMECKKRKYNIEPDVNLLSFIADCRILTEDEQYQKSLLIEPKLSSCDAASTESTGFLRTAKKYNFLARFNN